MKYILNYKNKEDFIEDNPEKEKIDLPVVWYSFGDGGIETEYEMMIEARGYNFHFKESGKTDSSLMAFMQEYLDYDTQSLGFEPLLTRPRFECIYGEGWYEDYNLRQVGEFTSGQLRVNAWYLNENTGDYDFVGDFPLTEIGTWVNEYQAGNYTDKYYMGAYTWENGTIVSAETKYEYYYNTGSENVLLYQCYGYLSLDAFEDWDWGDSIFYVAPKPMTTSAYTKFEKKTTYYEPDVYDEEVIPYVLVEPAGNNFLVKRFLMFLSNDLSSCGFTVSKNDWFGMYLPPNGTAKRSLNKTLNKMNKRVVEMDTTGSTKSRTSEKSNIVSRREKKLAEIKNRLNQKGALEDKKELVLGESPFDRDFVFGKFYTEGETGMTEGVYYNNNAHTSIDEIYRCYYMIFYAEGDDNKKPYYALTRYHWFSYWGSQDDDVYEGSYELYTDIYYHDSTGSRYSGEVLDCESFVGVITTLGNESPVPTKKESVTKIEPGFAYVKDPYSVYYNDFGGSDTPPEHVIPGDDTDTPGSNPLYD